MFTPARSYMTDAELDAARKRDQADGLCPAEQLIDAHSTNIPWMCSLDAGHDGRHEVYVDYTFTDGREPQRDVLAHSWATASLGCGGCGGSYATSTADNFDVEGTHICPLCGYGA